MTCEQSDGHRPTVRRLVVVDDDHVYLRLVRRQFRKFSEQIDVVLLQTAESAFDYLRGRIVDLIAIDVFMPGTDGLEACRQLRASGIVTPILVVSSYMTPTLQQQAFDAGATFVERKPTDLIARMELKSLSGVAADERQWLITEHMDLARNIARRLARQYASMMLPDDVDGLAMLGLCEAADRFDRARAEPFVAFAEQRIRGAVIDGIRRLGWCGRVTYKRQRKISGARRALTQTGEEATDDRVAEHLGLSVATVQRTPVRRSSVTDEDSTTLACPRATPADQVEHAQALEQLAWSREQLPPMEATIIKLRYDLAMSLAEIARTLEVSLGRVTILHASAVTRLREALRVCGADGD